MIAFGDADFFPENGMSVHLKNLAVSVSVGSLVMVGGSAAAQTLTAQDAGVDNFSRNRNTSVQQRSRPEFEAPGIRTGAFLVYPRIEVAAGTNDNLYATETNEVDDTTFNVRPEISIESDWSQNFLSAYARASVNRYADNDSENTDEYGLGTQGRIDVSRQTNIGFGADYFSGFEQRTAPSAPRNAVEPTGLDTYQAYLSASRSAGYLKLSGRVDIRGFDYANGLNGLGQVIEQNTRDRDVRSATGRVDFAVSPDSAFFFQATGNVREYDIASTPLVPNRDSSGSEFLVGANFEVSALVRGEVAVGYLEQDFDSAAFKDVDSFGGRAQLEWFPSQLTTVTAVAARTVEDTPTIGVGGILSSNISLGVDHELLRNVILSGRVTWGRDEYEGVDRDDTRLGLNLGGTYLLNRNLGVNATYSVFDVESKGGARDRDFTVNRLAIALVAQF